MDNYNCKYCDKLLLSQIDTIQICENGHRVDVGCWRKFCVRKKILGTTVSSCEFCQSPTALREEAIEVFNSLPQYTDEELSGAYDFLLSAIITRNYFDLDIIHDYVTTDIFITIILEKNREAYNDHFVHHLVEYSIMQKVLDEVDREVMTEYLNSETIIWRERIGLLMTEILLKSIIHGFEKENLSVLKRLFYDFNDRGIHEVFIRSFRNMTDRIDWYNDEGSLFRHRNYFTHKFLECLKNIFILLEKFQDEISSQLLSELNGFRDLRVFLVWIFDEYLMRNRNTKAVLFLITNMPEMDLNLLSINHIHYLFQNHYNVMFKMFFPNLNVKDTNRRSKRLKILNEGKVDGKTLNSIEDEEKKDLIINYFFERSQRFHDINKHLSRPLPSSVIQHIREFGGYMT